MRISYQTLQKFIDLKNVLPEQVLNCLNQLGIETKIQQNYQKLSQQLIVAQVLEKKKHPTSSKLWICQADTGTKKVMIVCGANNFNVNDKVILAPVGAKLDKGLTISKRKFANYTSEGMFCSWKELKICQKDDPGIAVLPNTAKTGDQNPLQYVGYNDLILKAETPWQEKELSSVFVLAKYLSKMLKKTMKLTDWQKETHQKPSPKQKEGLIVNVNLKWTNNPITLPSEIHNLLEKLQIEVKNDVFDNLINYIHCEIGFNLSEIGLNPQEKKLNIQNNIYSWQIKLAYQKKEQTKIRLPYILANYAYQRFLWWIKKILPEATITEEKSFCTKPEKLIISLLDLETILGKKIAKTTIVNTLEESIFTVDAESKTNQSDQLEISIPSYRWIKNTNQMVSEIIRLLGCNEIKPQPLTNTTVEWDTNADWKTEKAIRNYLLNLGFWENKNSVFYSKKENFLIKNKSKTISIYKNPDYNLQNSLIHNLVVKSQKKVNSFTIDKVFYAEKGELIEKTHLGIIFTKEWLQNPIFQEKISINHTFLTKITANICQIFSLSWKHLVKKQTSKEKNTEEVKKTWLNDYLFLNQGYEEIYHQKDKIGQIGWLDKNKSNPGFCYYLELNLTKLKEKQKLYGKRKKLQEKAAEKEIYADFSLQFFPEFEKKIYCSIDKNKIVECNHYQHLVEYIHLADKTVTKVELIDQYKKKSLTFRIWKRKEIKQNLSKKEEFKQINLAINQLKNAKMNPDKNYGSS